MLTNDQALTLCAKLETPLVLADADNAHDLVRLHAAEADLNKKANVDKAKADSKVRTEFSKSGKASPRAVKKK